MVSDCNWSTSMPCSEHRSQLSCSLLNEAAGRYLLDIRHSPLPLEEAAESQPWQLTCKSQQRIAAWPPRQPVSDSSSVPTKSILESHSTEMLNRSWIAPRKKETILPRSVCSQCSLPGNKLLQLSVKEGISRMGLHLVDSVLLHTTHKRENLIRIRNLTKY